ncbi:hypothetical protein RN001_009979 [Aquatica leii]|uniref:Sulfotransferase domain-containing protein n=1 Tax=Aquatica leii TaxID=1421715 RepID=A0AAN7QH61_9COLE|nr:hypothetical protein RN001_009979 [Aquatica leii]
MAINVKRIGSDTKLGAIINRDFLGERSHYIEVGPEKIVLPGKFEHFLDRFKKFEIRDDDVFVLAFPKSGSRWTQEMTWLLLNNLDFETALNQPLCKRSPLLDFEPLFDAPQNEYSYFHLVEESKSPRCIRSHLPWTLLPTAIINGTKQPKIIVVMRNPEDTCTSYYYQSTVIEGYSGTWNNFCELFLEGRVPYGPYWNHILGFWEQKHRSNIMFINYNKMKKDLASSIREVAHFLDINITDDNVKKLCTHLSFDSLKHNKAFNLEKIVDRKNVDLGQLVQSKEGDCNPFVRSGKIGDHKNMMSSETIQAFQDQRKKFLNGTDLNLD